MIVKRLRQYKIVQEETAEAFEKKMNALAEELPEDHEVKWMPTLGHCAYITYEVRQETWDRISDEFHAEGIHYLCRNCPHHEQVEDNRKKHVWCKYADYGHTHLDHEACEMFYKQVKQGEIIPEEG